MGLKVNVNFNEKENILEVDLIGELDIYTSKELRENVLSEFKKNNTDINIDAKKLDYVDSTGLGVLISILKEVKEAEKNIYISNAKPNVRKIFDITELDKLFIFRGESND